jgi:hypothetical protein
MKLFLANNFQQIENMTIHVVAFTKYKGITYAERLKTSRNKLQLFNETIFYI